MKLICVLSSSVSLTREAHLRLLAAAQALHATKKRQMDLEPDQTCAGRISTEWQAQALGTFAGPLFEAFLEIGDRTGTARFIVPERYLEEDLDPEKLLFTAIELGQGSQ